MILLKRHCMIWVSQVRKLYSWPKIIAFPSKEKRLVNPENFIVVNDLKMENKSFLYTNQWYTEHTYCGDVFNIEIQINVCFPWKLFKTALCYFTCTCIFGFADQDTLPLSGMPHIRFSKSGLIKRISLPRYVYVVSTWPCHNDNDNIFLH